MKKCFMLLMVTLTMLSCTKSFDEDNASQEGKYVVFKATQEINSSYDTVDTKTSLNGSVVYWSPNEEINIFFGNNSSKFTSMNTEKTTTASFSVMVLYLLML